MSYFSGTDDDLTTGHGQSLQQQRESFAHIVLMSLQKYIRSPIEIPQGFEMDLCRYLTRVETDLALNMMDVTDEQMDVYQRTETSSVMMTHIFRIVRRYVQSFFTIVVRVLIGLNKFVRNVGIVQCSGTTFLTKH